MQEPGSMALLLSVQAVQCRSCCLFYFANVQVLPSTLLPHSFSLPVPPGVASLPNCG